MDTAEIRKQTKEEIKGKHLKASLIFFIYIVFTAICGIIPIIGSLFIVITSIPLAYGVIVSIIKLKNGENVGYFDFFKIGFNEFANPWKVAFSTLGKIWPYLVGYFVSMIFIIISTIVFVLGAGLGATSIVLGIATLNPEPYINVANGTYYIALIFMIIGGIGLTVFSILLLLKSLYYSLVNYILYENSSLKGKEIVEKSYELMNGHRWDFIKLQIPYWLLCLAFNIIIGIFIGLCNVSDNNLAVSILSFVPMIYLLPLIQFSILNFYEKLKGNNE